MCYLVYLTFSLLTNCFPINLIYFVGTIHLIFYPCFDTLNQTTCLAHIPMHLTHLIDSSRVDKFWYNWLISYSHNYLVHLVPQQPNSQTTGEFNPLKTNPFGMVHWAYLPTKPTNMSLSHLVCSTHLFYPNPFELPKFSINLLTLVWPQAGFKPNMFRNLSRINGSITLWPRLTS